MAKSLPPVSAKVIADAEQFISEFRRADNAAKRSSANIEREIDDLAKKVKRKFQLGDIGQDILKGAGLFGGLNIANTAVDQIVTMFRESAELAEAIERRTEQALKFQQEMLRDRRTAEQNYQADLKKRAELLEQIKRLENPVATSMPVNANPDMINTGDVRSTLPVLAKQATDELTRLDAQLKATEESLSKQRTAENNKQAQDLFRHIEAQAEAADRAAAAYKVEFQKAMSDFFGLIEWNAEEEKKRVTEAIGAFFDDIPVASEIQMANIKRELAQFFGEVDLMAEEEKKRVDIGLDNFFGDLDRQGEEALEKLARQAEQRSMEMERVVGRAADNITDTWVDALNGSEDAWSNLADSVIREIQRMVVQILLVKPLINSLGSAIGTGGVLGALGSAMIGYGSPHARGGSVSAGTLYPVNEDGVELFKPNVGGEIIPMGAQRRGGSGGGNFTVNIDARGADAGAVARLESTVRELHGNFNRRAVSAVIAAKRGGGGTAAALA